MNIFSDLPPEPAEGAAPPLMPRVTPQERGSSAEVVVRRY